MAEKLLVRIYKYNEDGGLVSVIDEEVDGVFVSTAKVVDKGDCVQVNAGNACFGHWPVEAHERALREQQNFLEKGVVRSFVRAISGNDDLPEAFSNIFLRNKED